MIHQTSLSKTLDAVNEYAFNGESLPAPHRASVARFIAERQGLPRAYAGTFSGFPAELAEGILLFTGERITSASARHILGEEASRTLRLLKSRDPFVENALRAADESLMKWINQASLHPRNASPGYFCCPKCSVGMWRNLLSGGLNRQEERLRKGVGDVLHESRKPNGQWQTFPFWYTVLALSEMDLPAARKELTHAAPVLERAAKRARPTAKYAFRRHLLAERALKRV